MPHHRVRWPEFSRRQTRVLLIAAILLAAVLLFPPWIHEYHPEKNVRHQLFAGFHFVGAPPQTMATFQLHRTHVDYLTLAIELLGVIGFAGGALYTMADGLPHARRRHSVR